MSATRARTRRALWATLVVVGLALVPVIGGLFTGSGFESEAEELSPLAPTAGEIVMGGVGVVLGLAMLFAALWLVLWAAEKAGHALAKHRAA